MKAAEFLRRLPARTVFPLQLLVVAIAYYLGAIVGNKLSFGAEYVAPLWPPNAVLLTALLLSRPNRWVWFLLAIVPSEMAADIPNGIPWSNALGYAISDWVEVLVGATLLHRFSKLPPRFSTAQEGSLYVVCCVVCGPLVAAFPGALASTFGVTGASYWGAWRIWLVGDALTHFVMTPMLVLWSLGDFAMPRGSKVWRFVESIVALTALTIVSLLTLMRPAASASIVPILVYAPFPLLLWISLRFQPRVLAAASAILTLMAVWSTRANLGPFAGPTPVVNLIHLQTFLFLALAPMMLLSLLVLERNHAKKQRREIADRLRQSEKMEAVGQMAGGIAHDFNNLLTGILGNADLLHENAPEGGENRLMIDEIIASANRASELTQQLLSFSRRAPAQRTCFDICIQVDEVARLLGRSIDKKIDIQTEHQTTSGLIDGDPTQLHSALLNLGLNARDAMPDGGVLKFATSLTTLTETHCASYIEPLVPGPYVAILVSDTGCGINPSNLPKVFDPFFTTKDAGQGTGLGLAAVYGFARSHNGLVTVESRAEIGTVFRLLLPATDVGTPSFSKTENMAQPERHRGGRILVIDDEQVVREVIRRALEPLGYTVVTRADGRAGLLEFESSHHQYDLVLLDLVMPIMDGREVLRSIRSSSPGTPVIVISGYSATRNLDELKNEGAAEILHKPFSISDLQAAVGRLQRGASATFPLC